MTASPEQLKSSTEGPERSLKETYVLLANEIPRMAKEVSDAENWLMGRAAAAEPGLKLRSLARRIASSSFREWREYPLPFYSRPSPTGTFND